MYPWRACRYSWTQHYFIMYIHGILTGFTFCQTLIIILEAMSDTACLCTDIFRTNLRQDSNF